MRKILSSILCVVLVGVMLSFSACAKEETPTSTQTPTQTVAPTAPQETAPQTSSEVDSTYFDSESVQWEVQTSSVPEEAFKIAMDSMILGTTKQMDKSFDYSACGTFKNYAISFNRAVFSQLEYEICEVKKVDSENYVVDANFTNINVASVFAEGIEAWFLIVEADANNGVSRTAEENTAIMKASVENQIENYLNDTTTTNIQVNMKKVDGEWKVVITDEVMVAICGSEEAATHFAQ